MATIISSNERSLRSVFVGNIPYDATEEKLKDIFSEAGPVVSFRLVYDRETGKPKGYGFCEYEDQETALSAMRNLNGFELNGRTLRVDNAANERTKEEIRNLQSSLCGTFESPYGPEMDPEKAPEAISKAVASLPPEQMYELAKQMKQCIQTNPNEARNMLIQNPQLSYALLQALVVMKIVDPQVAQSILHRPNPNVPNLVPQDTPPAQVWNANATSENFIRSSIPSQSTSGSAVSSNMPFDPRSLDPRTRDTSGILDPRARPAGSFDLRISQQPMGASSVNNSTMGSGARPTMPASNNQRMPATLPQQEQEKAALIMQVLQLSDQQIAMLPAEQRQSIQLLKDQIARGNAQ